MNTDYTYPWYQVPPSYPVYPDYRSAQPVYHYHYYYNEPVTKTDNKITITPSFKEPTPIEVGDWVYSNNHNNPVIGLVEDITDDVLVVKGVFDGEIGDSWWLQIEYATKIERPWPQ